MNKQRKINPDPRRRDPGRLPTASPRRRVLAAPVIVPPALRWQAKLEALLFQAAEPISARRLIARLGLTSFTHFHEILAGLRTRMAADENAFEIVDIAGGYQLLSVPRYQPWLQRLYPATTANSLTPACRETLAVVAYRQPIMKAKIEQLRGVSSTDSLNQLIERGLVRVVGRHDSLGRPSLYGTTKLFLQTYGLRSLQDLPEVHSS
jgi:segregation and condensation protein B